MTTTDEDVFTLELERIPELLNTVSGFAALCKELCEVCMFNSGHRSRVILPVGDRVEQKNCMLVWNDDVPREIIEFHQDINKYTEFAAYAVAVLLLDCFTPYRISSMARIGKNMDFYLSKNEPEDDLIFNKVLRLEVSGILLERGSNTIDSRLATKMKRRKDIEESLEDWFVIVEFHSPKARMVKE